MPEALSPIAKGYYDKVKEFVEKKIIPREHEFFKYAEDSKTGWTINPELEKLKV